MRRPASQLYVGIAAVDVANRRTRSLPVVNAELFCKRLVYSLPREPNGGVDGR